MKPSHCFNVLCEHQDTSISHARITLLIHLWTMFFSLGFMVDYSNLIVISLGGSLSRAPPWVDFREMVTMETGVGVHRLHKLGMSCARNGRFLSCSRTVGVHFFVTDYLEVFKAPFRSLMYKIMTAFFVTLGSSNTQFWYWLLCLISKAYKRVLCRALLGRANQ